MKQPIMLLNELFDRAEKQGVDLSGYVKIGRIPVSRYTKCDECNGTGCGFGDNGRCETCDGYGEIRELP